MPKVSASRRPLAPAARFSTSRRPSTRTLLAAALGVSTLAGAGGAVAQTTRTVTTVGNGQGSLQSLLFQSQSGDTINFAPELRGSTISVFNEIRIFSGVTIDGGGTILNGRGENRIFFIDASRGFDGDDVLLRDLTLLNGADIGEPGGRATPDGGGGGGAAAIGGALYVASGDVVLEDVSLINSRAVGGDGGARGQGRTNEQFIEEFKRIVNEDYEPPENFEVAGGFGGQDDLDEFVFGGLRSTEDPEAVNPGQDGLDGDPGFPGSGGGGGAAGQTGSDGEDEAGLRGAGDGGNGGNGGPGGFGGGGGGAGPRAFAGDPADNGTIGQPGENGQPGEGGLGGGVGIRETGGGGAGLGGAIFVDQSGSLTLRFTGPVEISDSFVRRGRGGTPTRNDGQDAGALAFVLADTDLGVDVAQNASITLDGSDIADVTALRESDTFTSRLGIRKTGSGTLTLVQDPAFSGSLTAAGGRLSLNGNYSNNELIVQGDGTLAGTGTVNGFTNGGRVAPGNSIGTLNVAGDYDQSDNATLEVEFGRGGIDLLRVSGDANLSGTVSFVELEPGVRLLEPLTFVSAGGELDGSFSTEEKFLASGTDVLEIEVEYDRGGDVATATFVPVEPDFTSTASPSSAAVGGILNQLAGSPEDAARILNAVNRGLPLESILQSQGNVLASSTADAAQLAMTTTTNVARNRVSGVAVAARDARARRYTTLGQAEPERDPYLDYVSERGDTATDAGDPSAAAAVLARRDDEPTVVPALWIEGVGAFGNTDGDGRAFGSDSTTYGVSAGGEVALNQERSILGVFVGYTDTDTDVDDTNDSGETQNLQLGLYGAHRFDDHLHANAAGSVSFLSFDTERGTPFGTATGGFDGLGATGVAEVLYDFNLGRNIRLSPLVGVEAAFVDRDGYAESGADAFNLDVDDASSEYLSHLVGAEAAIGFPAGLLDWVLALRAGWSHQYLDTAASTTSRFALAGDSFTTSAAERDEDSVRLGAHIEFSPLTSHAWTAYARYDADLAGNYEEHTVRAGFRISF